MAGKSSRFFNAGYTKPKYMLPLGATSVFNEAIKSFKNYFSDDKFLFIIRDEFNSYNYVKAKCKELLIENFEIVTINFDTRGQAETVSIGLDKSQIKSLSDDIYIFNIDSIRLNFKKPQHKFLKNVEGYLEVFKGAGEHWSFVDPLNDQLVKKTTEKIRISNLCSNGLYYFKSIKVFQKYYGLMSKNNEYKELFVAPIYNFILQNKKIVKYMITEKENTLFSGTPEEYEALKVNFKRKVK